MYYENVNCSAYKQWNNQFKVVWVTYFCVVMQDRVRENTWLISQFRMCMWHQNPYPMTTGMGFWWVEIPIPIPMAKTCAKPMGLPLPVQTIRL
jgi:hypothetical protein